MPVPYSDNLYSSLDDDDAGVDEQQDALSPADGYFHASSSSDDASYAQIPQGDHQREQPLYPGVPSVPNVLVEDPTLREQDAAAKAREAAEERRLNSLMDQSSATVADGTYRHQYQPSSTSYRPPGPDRHHRRSVEDDPALYAGSSQPQPQPQPLPQPLTTSYLNHSTSSSSPASRPPFTVTPSDAPPAYTPRSPTSPTSPQTGASGYQTFGPNTVQSPTMGAPEEQQSLLHREPESMSGGPLSGPPPSRWQRFKDLRESGRLRKTIKKLLGALLLISIFLMLLSSFTIRSNHLSDGGKDQDPDVIDKDPIKSPGKWREDFNWVNLRRCYNDPYRLPTIVSKLTFNPEKSITVVEKINDSKGSLNQREPHVTGDLFIRRAGDGETGRLEVEVITNSRDFRFTSHVEDEHQVYTFMTPRRVDWSRPKESPCIQIRMTLHVPQGSVLDHLEIDLTHLDIHIAEGLGLALNNRSHLATVVGDVTTPEHSDKEDDSAFPYRFASREIYVETVSGEISGWFPLYDLLNLRSASGDITPYVTPKPADGEKPKPAVLDAKTISGELRVTESVAQASKDKKAAIPDRDYVVKLETVSGDIQAEVAVGSSSSFQSQSGDFNLKLWPLLDSSLLTASGASEPRLSTVTKSGDVSLELFEPKYVKVDGLRMDDGPTRGMPSDEADQDNDDPFLIIHPHDSPFQASSSSSDSPPLAALKSTHSTISGDLMLRYPASWTGELRAQTISGDQNIRGDGLSTHRESIGFPKVVEGIKGDGRSEIRLDTVSGDQDFLVGAETK